MPQHTWSAEGIFWLRNFLLVWYFTQASLLESNPTLTLAEVPLFVTENGGWTDNVNI